MLTPKECASRFIAWQRVREAERELAQTIKGPLQGKRYASFTIYEIDDILEELDR